jgi:hypothetical protein
METYGCCRVSHAQQHIDRQLLAMNDLQIRPHNIFVDKQSGKDFERAAYKKLVEKLSIGDLLCVSNIACLGFVYSVF